MKLKAFKINQQTSTWQADQISSSSKFSFECFSVSTLTKMRRGSGGGTFAGKEQWPIGLPKILDLPDFKIDRNNRMALESGALKMIRKVRPGK